MNEKGKSLYVQENDKDKKRGTGDGFPISFSILDKWRLMRGVTWHDDDTNSDGVVKIETQA